MQSPSVAVLGSGIMGSSAALALAGRGCRVVVFDASEEPFQAASRWNEGKIHLGYLYSANRDLDTARHLLPGGLQFKTLTERYIGCSIEPAVTTHDDIYLVHRDSVVSPAEMERYFANVDSLCRAHPDAHRYLVDLRRSSSKALSNAEIARDFDTRYVTAGFCVPERSVSTLWVADRFADALRGEEKIELVLNTRVRGVASDSGNMEPPMYVKTDHGAVGPFDIVINSLWEGRPLLDAAFGLFPSAPWSHRFRLSLFLQTREDVSCGCAVIAAGPFGDIKQYTGRDFYLSWYPAGLLAEGTELAPPAVSEIGSSVEKEVTESTFAGLETILPVVRELRDKASSVRVKGGWVYACGRGPLSDPASTLHRRDHPNIHRHGAYISIDTGKYSIAPWLAEKISVELCG